MPRAALKKAIKARLLASRWGRWALIGKYPTYLDQFARVMRATADYHGAEQRKSVRFRLHRCIHRLEKGLAMPRRRTGSGRDAMVELARLLRAWERAGGEPSHPTRLWGLDVAGRCFETLDADLARAADPADRARLAALRDELREKWSGLALREPAQRLETPLPMHRLPGEEGVVWLEALLEARKSVRRWLDEPVPREVVRRALEHALRAPSACNRQPLGVVAMEDPALVREAASLLTGGKGFAEDAPLLLALVSDYGAYGGHEQRNLAFIDGGLAAMGFMLSLAAQGYGAVSMNWSVEVERDLKMRRLLGLEETQVILFFVGVGRPHPDALIPASVRRPADDTIRWIGPARAPASQPSPAAAQTVGAA